MALSTVLENGPNDSSRQLFVEFNEKWKAATFRRLGQRQHLVDFNEMLKTGTARSLPILTTLTKVKVTKGSTNARAYPSIASCLALIDIVTRHVNVSRCAPFDASRVFREGGGIIVNPATTKRFWRDPGASCVGCEHDVRCVQPMPMRHKSSWEQHVRITIAPDSPR